MKICAAQSKPIKGDISKNIENHKKLIMLAVQKKVDIIIFPELSLTGYEPELAEKLATTVDDPILKTFQKISDSENIVIVFGLPTKSSKGICISSAIFQPKLNPTAYEKEHLHSSEFGYFTSGKNSAPISYKDNKLAFAICFETSVPEHSKKAFEDKANIYLASVVNSFEGVDIDIDRISKIAKKYKMTALMANLIGQSGNYNCAGKSSIWNNEGVLVGQLNNTNEGLLIYDTATAEIIKIQE